MIHRPYGRQYRRDKRGFMHCRGKRGFMHCRDIRGFIHRRHIGGFIHRRHIGGFPQISSDVLPDQRLTLKFRGLGKGNVYSCLDRAGEEKCISQKVFINQFWKVNSTTKLSTYCTLLLIQISS